MQEKHKKFPAVLMLIGILGLYSLVGGMGKTRTGAETVNKLVRENKIKKIGLIAPTAADCRDVMVEGESGILKTSPLDFMPEYFSSKRKVVWPNGAEAHLYCAETPDRLNGPQHDFLWHDELGVWKYGQSTWDMSQFGLRLGIAKQVITTTPKVKNLSLIKSIIKESTTHLTTGTTYENLRNLSKIFKQKILKYQGTRLGKQELLAQLLEDIPGALWRRKLIDDLRIDSTRLPELMNRFIRIVVGVDPRGGSDDPEKDEEISETGIVICAKDLSGKGFVLGDWSMRGRPNEWGSKAIEAFRNFNADLIVGEVNNGGQMIESVLRAISPDIPYKSVRASRGKIIRAEPISTLYEREIMHHVGIFSVLEDQMCSYAGQKDDDSPDHMDAMVWAFTELFVDAVEGFEDTVIVSEGIDVDDQLRMTDDFDV